MTEPYTYADTPDGCELSFQAYPPEGVSPAVLVHACEDGVRVPLDELHDVIAGLLAIAAAAQGRTWTSALAQARDDTATLANITAGETPQRLAALARTHYEHLPLLLALAEAYTGQDAPLWHQYRQVQAERDTARFNNGALQAATRLAQEEADKLRAEAAELRTRMHKLEDVRTEALADAEQLRARLVAVETIARAGGGTVRSDILAVLDDDTDATEFATGGIVTNPAAIGPGDNGGCIIPARKATPRGPGMTADQWNTHHPVGTPVHAWLGRRDEAPLVTRTRSDAWNLGHGEPVVSVDGYAGGIALTHIEPRPDDTPEQP
ncbi:hypothetical protein [Yinghuangia soli]|uniref:Uncharacterized protein n=1 Tax=Yinghuangia soli TaxID=2908204 RepID=A0AA41Q7R7_9ACTN|nr:hypothetical protein [Yinghuangia soli]MCF2531732.1 hypothetical protein [Yinghuangia soli]